jgi:hypothetical protein
VKTYFGEEGWRSLESFADWVAAMSVAETAPDNCCYCCSGHIEQLGFAAA